MANLFKIPLSCVEGPLEGHSQLALMRIRYHFMVNMHTTETRSVLFLTKYDKGITG